ncbi:MAG: sigma 54-interacting transcriptional regulator [Planctomycetota bacterium]
MKPKTLSYSLNFIKSALDKENFVQAERYGESTRKKLPSLSYCPKEEYRLYLFLGWAYYRQGKYSRAIEMFYKAYLIATKNSFPPADVIWSVWFMGGTFVSMLNIKSAIYQLRKVEEYYRKYGDNIPPMDKNTRVCSIIALGYCYLSENQMENVRQIIKEKLPVYQPFIKPHDLVQYKQLEAEYLLRIEEYTKSRQLLAESIKLAEHINYQCGILTSKIHLASIDLIDGQVSSAISSLTDVMKEARRSQRNDVFCDAGLILNKWYTFKNMPQKAGSIEKKIKFILSKIDIIWLYHKMRELDTFFRQIQSRGITDTSESLKNTEDVLRIRLAQRLKKTFPQEIIIGQSPEMQEVWQLIEKIAPTDLPILIQGETGTGKELFAQAIHKNSPRANKPLLSINCGTISETLMESQLFGHTKGAFTGAVEDKKGYIELATGGSLLIDEISDMSPGMQQKLLRVLEDGQIWPIGAQASIAVNTRFIFATNQNIGELVNKKRFREDLFYRINTITVNLPPLRDRKQDIPLLVEHFFRRYMRTGDKHHPELFAKGLEILMGYSWPGNVRELENEIKRICIMCPTTKSINESMISENIRNPLSGAFPNKSGVSSLKEMSEAYQRDIITQTLRKTQGNISDAAKLLGYDRVNLYRKIKQLKMPFPPRVSKTTHL